MKSTIMIEDGDAVITLPDEIIDALELQQGDKLVWEISGDAEASLLGIQIMIRKLEE